MTAEPVDPWAVIEAVFPKAVPNHAPRPPVTLRVADTGSSYATVALDNEAQSVIDAPAGTRNHALNRAAFNLGQLVAGGALDEADVAQTLTHAAQQAGLDDSEIPATIRSGLSKGALTPRGVPAPVDVDSWLAGIGPAVDPQTGEIDPENAAAVRSAAIRTNLPTLDWHALWADQDEEEWIIEPLLPARRLVALYSAPKVGKSLLMLELAVAIVTGRDVLGVTLDRPRSVLYVDFENDPKADIRERLQAMGVGPDDLARLHYLSFPTLAALDSDRGGLELMAAVAEYGCEVVVVDTVSRAIQGEENENDTWLNFYRHTGLRMKQAGIALIRLDHSGKDETKGQRGGSAKSGDVDAVWRLSKVTDGVYRLDCEAARMPITEKTVVLHRETTPLRHRVDAEGKSAAARIKVTAVVAALDKLGAPDGATRDESGQILRAAGEKAGTWLLGEAVRERQRRAGFSSKNGVDERS
ncbi:MAG: hypothetical protein NVS3B18_08700 [Candidatus Dormibacteria bacterium]